MRLSAQYLAIFFTMSILLSASLANQVSAEDAPESKHQASQEVSADDIECEEELVLVWKNDGTPECVKPENVLKLVESGWLPHETIDQISISDKRMHEVSENVYAFQFDYCAAVYNEDALGIIISSNVENIPVQIDPNIQINQCQQYGTQIHTLSDSPLRTSLFYEEDMQTLFKSFDKKKADLEKDLIYNQQKLQKLQDPNLNDDNLEEIEMVKIQIEWINIAIQSYKEGLNTLRSLQ